MHHLHLLTQNKQLPFQEPEKEQKMKWSSWWGWCLLLASIKYKRSVHRCVISILKQTKKKLLFKHLKCWLPFILPYCPISLVSALKHPSNLIGKTKMRENSFLHSLAFRRLNCFGLSSASSKADREHWGKVATIPTPLHLLFL